MIVYSFAGDYARTFKNHGITVLPFIRWGSLLMAMGLSLQLAVRYQNLITTKGMWVFILVGFAVIFIAKLLFRTYLKRKGFR